jgi:hypothetical protein
MQDYLELETLFIELIREAWLQLEKYLHPRNHELTA